MSGVWFRHAANFGEHPKTLKLRRLAGKRADAAECGWWRILEAAKRYGSWSFDDDDHLIHAAGRYAPFIPIYREVGFLDGLTIHNGEEYQAPMTVAERVAKHRSSNADHVTHPVTDVTPRAEQTRADKKEQSNDDGRADLEAFLMIRRRAPTPKQRRLLDEVMDRHDLTGPAWAADLMYKHPDDPIGAVIEADRAWRGERIAAAQAAEAPKPTERRPRGLPQTTREIMSEMALLKAETA